MTCEVTVHHLTLTDEACATYSSATRVSPPLRSMDHVEACRQALKDGTADAIVTDHAPHAPEEKMLSSVMHRTVLQALKLLWA